VIKRIAAALILIAVIAVPVRADFDDVATAISRKIGVRKTWIPFLGVARFAVWIIRPTGVHDFQLATFEGGHGVDPRELRAILTAKAGQGFAPLVQVYSRRSNEYSFVFARPGKKANRMELIVLTSEDDETTLVRVDVDGEVLARNLNDPKNVGVRMARASD
jgi:hypothetical protein